MRCGSLKALSTIEQISRTGAKCKCAEVILPPAELRKLVNGTEDVESFLSAGHLRALSIVKLLETSGVDVSSLDAILDFGCGVGQTLTHLSCILDKAVSGTDCDQKLVVWTTNNVRRGFIYLNEIYPPTQHIASSFDLVYANFVFEQMSEPDQIEWIAEFARIIKVGGYLILTDCKNIQFAEDLRRITSAQFELLKFEEFCVPGAPPQDIYLFSRTP